MTGSSPEAGEKVDISEEAVMTTCNFLAGIAISHPHLAGPPTRAMDQLHALRLQLTAAEKRVQQLESRLVKPRPSDRELDDPFLRDGGL